MDADAIASQHETKIADHLMCEPGYGGKARPETVVAFSGHSALVSE